MKNRQACLLMVACLFCAQLQAFSQAPVFTGTWVLNLEKSRLENKPDGLTGSIFIIEQNGNRFRLTRYHLFGEKKNKIRFTMIADGKTRRMKILFKSKLENTENGLRATIWRKHFSNIVHYKFGNNPDEFIADEVFTGKSGRHHNSWVFEKQPSQ
ncbi:MAG: hypothetical protein QM664_11150 [Flavihumibacter sp.]